MSKRSISTARSDAALPAENYFTTLANRFHMLLIVTVATAMLIAADICLRSIDQDAAAVHQTAGLGMFRFAASPADSPVPSLQMRHPGVDLRYSAQMPFQDEPVTAVSTFAQPGAAPRP